MLRCQKGIGNRCNLHRLSTDIDVWMCFDFREDVSWLVAKYCGEDVITIASDCRQRCLITVPRYRATELLQIPKTDQAFFRATGHQS